MKRIKITIVFACGCEQRSGRWERAGRSGRWVGKWRKPVGRLDASRVGATVPAICFSFSLFRPQATVVAAFSLVHRHTTGTIVRNSSKQLVCEIQVVHHPLKSFATI